MTKKPAGASALALWKRNMATITIDSKQSAIRLGDLIRLLCNVHSPPGEVPLQPHHEPHLQSMSAFMAQCVRDHMELINNMIDGGQIILRQPPWMTPIDPASVMEWDGDLMVSRDDLQKVCASLLIEVVQKEATPPDGQPFSDAGPVTAEASLNLKRLATRTELLAAFEVWGLKRIWFDALKDRAWLLAARKVKGRGQRGHSTEPLFCPFEVMDGLTTKVKPPRRLSEEKGWTILERAFPACYAHFEIRDPRERTG